MTRAESLHAIAQLAQRIANARPASGRAVPGRLNALAWAHYDRVVDDGDLLRCLVALGNMVDKL